MNLLQFQLPRGAGTIGVHIPVSSEGLSRLQTLLGDPALQGMDFSIQGVTIGLELSSPVLSNYFDLEPEARFMCRLNLVLEEKGVYAITLTVFEVGYEAHAVTSLPLLCQIDLQGRVVNVSLI